MMCSFKKLAAVIMVLAIFPSAASAACSYKSGNVLLCLSSDSKLSASEGTRLYETDTLREYLRIGGTWETITTISLPFTAITGSATDAQMSEHTALTGTNVHGLGTMATETATNYPTTLTFSSDMFLSQAGDMQPWILSGVNSGTIASIATTSNHPGAVRFTSSTSANSGFKANTQSWLLLAGDEHSEAIISLPTTSAGTTIRSGFHDALIITAPTDGCWIEIVNTTATGYCKNNAGPTATATTYTVTTGTWYHLYVDINAAATLATFSIKAENGSVLWTDTVAANIPTGAGRDTGNSIYASNSGTSAIALLDVDYIMMKINRTLAR